LPDDWTTRIRRLSHNTVVHIPVALRQRLAELTTDVWEGMANGSAAWAAFEEGRTKLILGGIPEGAHVAREVGIRVSIWEAGDIEGLLRRVELQHTSNKPKKAKKQAGADAKKDVDDQHITDAQRDNIIRMIKEGAFKEATQAVIEDAMQVSPEDSLHWANVLHPPSRKQDWAAPHFEAGSASGGPAQWLPATGIDASATQSTAKIVTNNPLRGIRFGALKAPSPSGARPEHLAELLGVRRRRTGNKLAKALDKLLERIEAGSLPEEARWLCRSRTIFLEKKTGKAPRDRRGPQNGGGEEDCQPAPS
jgi:hypothetical protein